MTAFKVGATAHFRAFLLVASSDHVTGLTGAGTTPTVKFSRGGAPFVTPDEVNNSGATPHEIGNGWYYLEEDPIDTGLIGDFAWRTTVASADPTDFTDQIVGHVADDLSLDASGHTTIASSFKKNKPVNGFTFVMTNVSTGAAQAGLTVTAQRSLNGGAFASCANSVTELSNGVYSINLNVTDTNANTILLRFSATGANDLDIAVITQP